VLAEGGLRPSALKKGQEEEGVPFVRKRIRDSGGCRAFAQFRTVFFTASEVGKSTLFSTMLQNAPKATSPMIGFKGLPVLLE